MGRLKPPLPNPFSSPLRDCVVIGGNAMSVILNEVKNLVESMGWKTEILRLMPQNDIATQSLRGEERVRGRYALCSMLCGYLRSARLNQGR
jgi:hypothetical protein